jgi:hypothetical protein
MREFGEKYNGDVQAALRGLQRERMVEAGGGVGDMEIYKSVRKRKWVASVEAAEAVGSRSFKNGASFFFWRGVRYENVLTDGLTRFWKSSYELCISEEKTRVVNWAWDSPTCTPHRIQTTSWNSEPTITTTHNPTSYTLILYIYSLAQWDASQPPQAPPNQHVQPNLQLNHAPHPPPNPTQT